MPAAFYTKWPAYLRGLLSFVLPFRHADRLDIVPVLAVIIDAQLDALAASADLVIPAPLHPARYVKRRYNQYAELARWLEKIF